MYPKPHLKSEIYLQIFIFWSTTTNMTNSNPHNLNYYKERYFEYKIIEKSFGKPSIDDILRIFCKLKWNSQRVPTSLGGGRHGYLALLLSNTSYLSIPHTAAFNRPRNPGIFIPDQIRTTPSVTIRSTSASGSSTAPTLRDPTHTKLAGQLSTHNEGVRPYLEVKTVETLLHNQLLSAFDDAYL